MRIELDPEHDEAFATEMLDALLDKFPELVARELSYDSASTCEVFRRLESCPGVIAEAVFKLAGNAYVPPDNRKELAPSRLRAQQLVKLLGDNGFLDMLECDPEADEMATLLAIVDKEARGIVG
jgi:hypothetical protein